MTQPNVKDESRSTAAKASYTSDPERMAEIILAEAGARQGQPRGDAAASWRSRSPGPHQAALRAQHPPRRHRDGGKRGRPGGAVPTRLLQPDVRDGADADVALTDRQTPVKTVSAC